MKSSVEKNFDPVPNSSKKILSDNCSNDKILGSVSCEAEPSLDNSNQQNSTALWSGAWPPVFSIFGSPSSSNCSKTDSENRGCDTSGSNRKKTAGKNYYEGWRAAVRRIMMNGVSMRRILGFNRASVSASRSDIWLLGICYQVATQGDEASSSDPTQSEGFAAFVEDFSSRIMITYRKGSVHVYYVDDVF